MTAYKLADELDKYKGIATRDAAKMLRQQADRIAELEREVEHYKNKIEYLDKREIELLAELTSLEKDLHMIQRHYDQLESTK